MSKQTDLINIPDAITVDGSGIVNLDSTFSSGTTGGIIRLKDGGTQFGDLNEDSGNFLISSAQVDKDIIFKGNDGGAVITAMTIDMSAGGKVGIGSPPAHSLHIEKAGTQFIFLNNASTNDGFYFKAGTGASSIQTNGGSNVMNFFTSGNERMKIDASGRVTMPNQPSFRAFKSSSQTAGSANETVTWSATYHNVGNHFNTTSGTFTAPVAGAYQFALTCLTPNAANTLNLHITLNGSNNNGVRMRVAQANGHTTGCVTGVLNLNASDYVQVRLENQGGQLYGDASQSWTTFSGHLLG